MTNQDLVEKIARGIHERCGALDLMPGDIASAAIAAIEAEGLVIVKREPTEMMVQRGSEALELSMYGRQSEPPAALCYRAMINHHTGGE